MPELPEVETMRRGILPIVGSRVREVSAPKIDRKPILLRPKLAAMSRRLAGRTVTAVDRLGKRVVVRFNGGEALVFEPRMTGLVLVADAPTQEHLRFCLSLRGGPIPRVWYWDRRGLGSVRLFTAVELAGELGEKKLGPDALAITVAALAERVGRGRRHIKPALLDQKLVAGVGNLYASEILHLARMNPRRRCHRVTAAEWERIHAAMLTVLHEAIRYEGSTLADGTYRNALNTEGGYQNQHRVYDKAGETCPTCRHAVIVRMVQTQRSTFYCPRCQKK